MIRVALAVAAVTLTVGLTAATALGLFRSVHARLVALTLLAGALPIAAVLLSGTAMVHMGSDVVLVAVAIASSVVAVVGALLVTRSVSRPLRELRASTARLASGDFGARVAEHGPAELAEVGVAFNEMTGRLEELFDARRQLVAWASHDLRAPVSSLQAMLEAVEDGVARPEEYLPAMRQQVQALRVLIDDLFELAQIDANGEVLQTQGLPIDRLVASSLDGFIAEAAARGVLLQRRLEPRLPDVEASPEKIERVLRNLLDNALRHTPADGSVTVTAQRSNGEVVVAVEDTGEGIPHGSTRAMFDRFWRADRARDRSRGEGGGARVAFTLPLANADRRTPAGV